MTGVICWMCSGLPATKQAAPRQRAYPLLRVNICFCVRVRAPMIGVLIWLRSGALLLWMRCCRSAPAANATTRRAANRRTPPPAAPLPPVDVDSITARRCPCAACRLWPRTVESVAGRRVTVRCDGQSAHTGPLRSSRRRHLMWAGEKLLPPSARQTPPIREVALRQKRRWPVGRRRELCHDPKYFG